MPDTQNVTALAPIPTMIPRRDIEAPLRSSVLQRCANSIELLYQKCKRRMSGTEAGYVSPACKGGTPESQAEAAGCPPSSLAPRAVVLTSRSAAGTVRGCRGVLFDPAATQQQERILETGAGAMSVKAVGWDMRLLHRAAAPRLALGASCGLHTWYLLATQRCGGSRHAKQNLSLVGLAHRGRTCKI